MAGLRLLFTSDMHGFLLPTDYVTPGERPMGLAKLAAAFQRDENTLLIDGGDNLLGSLMTDYISRVPPMTPHPVAEAMNLAGYDYVTLGNHDFNYGLDALERYLRGMRAQCVCANIRDKAGRLPIQPWVARTMPNGLRVGLTGACTHYVRRWEKRETVEQLHIEPPIPALARALDAMRGLCDVTVCVYHGGFERDLQTGRTLTRSDENQACAIAEKLGFDILLTGHQHIAVERARLGRSWAAQTADRAPHYVQMDVDVSAEGVTARSRLMPPAEAADARITALLTPLNERVERWLDQPAGRLSQPIPAGLPLERALRGSLAANFINQVQLEATGAEISAASLPNDYPGMPRGVTVRSVMASYPYSNTLTVLRVSGDTLRRYVEHTASYFTLTDGRPAVSEAFLRPKVEHYNYDFFSGMEYTLDLRKPVGERVTRMERGGAPIRPEDEILLCVNSYRASGTGGYDMLEGAEVVREVQREVSALLVEKIEREPVTRVDDKQYLHTVWE